MQTLNDVVLDTVRDFVKNGLLFTGLDVSNKVKEVMPFARHSEVSEAVRSLFCSEMETQGYARTPINVTLKDGSTRTAMLYHSLSDSWDLDNKYDAQKRSQTTTKPSPAASDASAALLPNGTINVNALPPAPALITPAAPVPPAQAWAQLFNSQPSLFPLK